MILILTIILGTGHFIYGLVHLVLLKGLIRLEKITPDNPLGEKPSDGAPSVSVLMSIRNEGSVLSKVLSSLQSQNYPLDKLQLVLVNDRSSDSTLEILKEFKANNPFKTVVVSIEATPPNISPKKYALGQGFLKCTGEIILSTDADCHFGTNWISSLIQYFKPNTGMVVGMTTYYPDDKMSSLLWGMQSLEFFSHAVVASSMISNHFPINTNANNMAFRKEAYLEASNLRSYDHVVSGDDDFLLQQMASLNKWQIIYASHKDSQVLTRPTPTVKAIWEQRKRWGSKTTHYGAKQVLFLSFVYLYYLSILLFTVMGAFNIWYFYVGALSWLLKSWFDYRVIAKACKIFSKEKLKKWFIPTAIAQLVMIVVVIPIGTFGTFTWKDNRTRKTV